MIPDYSIIIPVYNAGPALTGLIHRIEKVFHEQLQSSFEIIIVNDGSSSEETNNILSKLSHQPDLKIAYLMRNFGKANAVLCGLNLSEGKHIITIDDDLQQIPEDIPLLIAQKEHDVVIGAYKEKKHTWLQRITSTIKQIADRLILGITIPMSPLKLISRPVVDQMLAINTNQPFIPALIANATNDIVSVNLKHNESAYGESRFHFRSRLRQFTSLIIGNSNILLRLLTYLGVLIVLIGILFSISAFFISTTGNTHTTNDALMAVILLVGGINLGALGVVGEYLIRILHSTTQKPAYVIRKIHEPD